MGKRFVIGGPISRLWLQRRKNLCRHPRWRKYGGAHFRKRPIALIPAPLWRSPCRAKKYCCSWLADKCLVQVSWRNWCRTTNISNGWNLWYRQSIDEVSNAIADFDLRPKGIVKMLDLLRPIYQNCGLSGHFGRWAWSSLGKTQIRQLIKSNSWLQ
jgi:S-adenosylmethionine synthetase